MILRNMTREELPLVLDWAAQEGWNPGLDDAAAFWAADPDGFFVAEQDGEVAAAISVVNHAPEFAFLGLYIARPDYRGQGIGYALWQHALEHAEDRVVGLDGVPDQQENYRKSGFQGASETYRFEGRIMGQEAVHVRRVDAADIPAIAAMDAEANGYAKTAFLRAWLTDTPSRHSFVWATGAGPEGAVTIRTCRSRAKIGPLLAPDAETAIALIRAAAARTGREHVIVDVPAEQTALMGWCKSKGMTCAFNTARMYRGAAPSAGVAVRSIATLELG